MEHQQAIALPHRTATNVALILSSIDGQVQAALYMPILALISQTFKNSPLINFSFSVTSGVMVIVIFIAGHLARRFDKRTLMIIGTVLFIAGGFLGSMSPTAEFLVGTRILEGVGAGLVYPMVPAITAHLFKEKERTQLMGMLNGGACLIAFFLNFGAGFLGALFGWRFCLGIYAILAVAIFMQIKYIPRLGPETTISDLVSTTAVKRRLPKAVYLLALANLAFTCVGQVFNMTLSGFIIDTGIGTTTIAGTAGSIQTLIGFFIGLVFERLIRKLGNFAPVVALLCLSICYFGLSLSTNALGVYLSIAFIGMSCGIVFPLLNECVARVTISENVTLGMSYVSIGMLLGNFLCSFWVQFLTNVSGTYIGIFQITGTITLVGAIAFAALAVIKSHNTGCKKGK